MGRGSKNRELRVNTLLLYLTIDERGRRLRGIVGGYMGVSSQSGISLEILLPKALSSVSWNYLLG